MVISELKIKPFLIFDKSHCLQSLGTSYKILTNAGLLSTNQPTIFTEQYITEYSISIGYFTIPKTDGVYERGNFIDF